MIETNINNLGTEEIAQEIKQELKKRREAGKLHIHKNYYETDDFMRYDGEAFIEKAYRYLLKREPDELGLRLFLKPLQIGEYSKLDILKAIRFSDEGKSKNVKVLGLDKHSYLYEILNSTTTYNTLTEKPFIQKSYYEVNDLLQYDDAEFIRNLYQGLLERDPDEEGMQQHLNQLRTGECTKIEILKVIRFSDEGRFKDVKITGITDGNMMSSNSAKKPFVQKNYYTISDFLQYYDLDFILNLYKGLLGREPGKEETRDHINRLRTGEKSKIEILTAIRFSKEGKSNNIKVIGIDKYYLINTLNRIPILGYFSKSIIALLTLPKLLKRLNKYENYGSLLNTAQESRADIDTLLNASRLSLKHEAELNALQLRLGSKAEKRDLDTLRIILAKADSKRN